MRLARVCAGKLKEASKVWEQFFFHFRFRYDSRSWDKNEAGTFLLDSLVGKGVLILGDYREESIFFPLTSTYINAIALRYG